MRKPSLPGRIALDVIARTLVLPIACLRHTPRGEGNA